jgi:hypothetical protein
MSSGRRQEEYRGSSQGAQDDEVSPSSLTPIPSTMSLTDNLSGSPAPPAPKRSVSPTPSCCKRPTGPKSRSTRASHHLACPSGSGSMMPRSSRTRTTRSALRTFRTASDWKMMSEFRRTTRRVTSLSRGVLTPSWMISMRAKRLIWVLDNGCEQMRSFR